MKRKLTLLLLGFSLSASLWVFGCSTEDSPNDNSGGSAGAAATGGTAPTSGGGGPTASGGAGGEGGLALVLPPASTVDELTNVSADNYAHNRWGLIEADTLETYVTSWGTPDSSAADAPANGRPAHLTSDARLIILQLNAADRADGEDYIPSNASSKVYTFELSPFRFNETRDTGLISNSVRYQASGPTTDAWLADYGIDLSRDFVVFAAGANSASNGGFFQDLARAIYWLQYWGADAKHLAIVNGTLQKNYTGTLVASKLSAGSISNDGFSVKDLFTDNTGLTIPLEDFQAIVDAELSAEGIVEGFEEQFIIDARPTPQFNRTAAGASFVDTHPGQFITTSWGSSGPPSNDATGKAKSYVLFEGHVKGAVSFPWANLLEDVGGNNFKYKSKAALTAVFTNAGYPPSHASSKVIVSQCRTNFEVQVNGFAARIILGYPIVHYDGSLVEYFSLVSNHPTTALNLLPTDPAYRYRTDTATRSQLYTASANPEAPTTTENDDGVVAYNVGSGSAASDRKVEQAVVNRNATTTRQALDADIEYKRQYPPN